MHDTRHIIAVNPYQSPRHVEEPPTRQQTERQRALWRIRWALIALAIPSACNWLCLSFVGSPRMYDLPPLDIAILLAAVNFVLAVGTMAAVWFFALKAFDIVALAIRLLFGRGVSRDDWLGSLYDSLWPLGWAARIGALLWLMWLYLFYFETWPGLLVLNNVFGAMGHALAAWVYVTLFIGWYRVIYRNPANDNPPYHNPPRKQGNPASTG